MNVPTWKTARFPLSYSDIAGVSSLGLYSSKSNTCLCNETKQRYFSTEDSLHIIGAGEACAMNLGEALNATTMGAAVRKL